MPAPQAPELLLAVLDAPLPASAPALLGSLGTPALRGAWTRPLAPQDLWDQGLCQELSRAGLTCGLLGLPLPRPLPELPGWQAAALAGRDDRFARPTELALDLGDYAAGQLAVLQAPAPQPHARDYQFALWACLARLVFEQARRLLRAQPPDLAGLGFQGLAWTAQAFADSPARVDLLWQQVDHYLTSLAQELRPRALLCLLGPHEFLAWAPEGLAPGELASCQTLGPQGLLQRLLGLGTGGKDQEGREHNPNP